MITFVVGGQFGGEGKGKITSALARLRKYDVVCRCGGVNSSHTVVLGGEEYRMRMLPASTLVDKRPLVVFGPGSLIHIATLVREIGMVGYDPSRIHIHPQAGIVTDDCVEEQRKDSRYHAIGSTLTGTGYAAAKRALRKLPLARDFPVLSRHIVETTELLHRAARAGRHILIEGHQGIGLSNYHGDYPFTSSRDCTVAEMFSELGLATHWGHRIILVLKVFPTRNHPGSLYAEMTSEEADVLGVKEFGGGSWGGIQDARRRVGVFDFGQVRKAMITTMPDYLAITGMDYWDPASAGANSAEQLTPNALKFVEDLEQRTRTPVCFISTGRDTSHFVMLPNAVQARGEKTRSRKPHSSSDQIDFDF